MKLEHRVLVVSFACFAAASFLGCSSSPPPAITASERAAGAGAGTGAGTAAGTAAGAEAGAAADAAADPDLLVDQKADELPAPADRITPKRPVYKVPEELVGVWDLVSVRYKEGSPFVPKFYGGFEIRANGLMDWYDGCKRSSTSATASGGKISVDPQIVSSLNTCPGFKVEDVHYAAATRYNLRNGALTLITAEQTYELQKHPYSRMSQRSWSLHSIKDQKTGVLFDVDRFRPDDGYLFLRVKKDATFLFSDLDREEFNGTLEVAGDKIRGMTFDPASKERLLKKPVKREQLKDRFRSRITTGKYPTSYAHSIHWEDITQFKVYDGALRTKSGEEQEVEVLELSSEKKIYRFIAW